MSPREVYAKNKIINSKNGLFDNVHIPYVCITFNPYIFTVRFMKVRRLSSAGATTS